MALSEFLQFLFSGLTVGFIYGAVALGFTVIYNASHVVNFAQGEFVMLGGMFTVLGITVGLPYPLAALLAIAGTALVSVLLYEFAIRPARNAPVFALIIITIGASIMIRGLAQVYFGTSFFSLPALLGDTPINIYGAVILPQSIVVVLGTLAMVVLLVVLMRRTMIGKALIAASSDLVAARLVGINVRMIVRLSFVISAVLASVAGILIAPIALTSYDIGVLLALKGFAAVMLGGIGNPVGALVGGILVGLGEAMTAGYISSDYKDAAAFVIILAVLFAFPNGLFGRAQHERV
ncbi:MAG: branched-chain amino acid ABC transporter permease [Rhodobacteraceae bacterium]|nr:branched-chain amino acid ABC transporter permease [Paracoccaceae bacterium]